MTQQDLPTAIAAVTAYGDFLTALRAAGKQINNRDPQFRALRAAAGPFLEELTDWAEIARNGDVYILESPQGQRVRYWSTGVCECVALVEAPQEDLLPVPPPISACTCHQGSSSCPVHPLQPLPIGLCDYCARHLHTDYLTISIGEQGHYVCTESHARALAALTPDAALRFEARSRMDVYQFVCAQDTEHDEEADLCEVHP